MISLKGVKGEIMNLIKKCCFVLSLLWLVACEKTPVEQAGVIVSADMPQAQRLLLEMIPDEPRAYAKQNIDNGNRRLLAYQSSNGMQRNPLRMA